MQNERQRDASIDDCGNFVYLPTNGYSFLANGYLLPFHEIFAVQNNLSNELMTNASLLNQINQQRHERSQQDPFQCQHPPTKNASQIKIEDNNYDLEESKKKYQTNKKKNHESPSEEDSYHPEEQYSIENGHPKVSQSKNIPKNYGKAILNFIRKNQNFARRVLHHVGKDYDEFIEKVASVRKSINTIKQLRGLWIEGQEKFAKAFRIFSMQYLRKHSFPYIFNSRVQNFGKHIKYRYKIIQSVQSPQNFTRMKQF